MRVEPPPEPRDGRQGDKGRELPRKLLENFVDHTSDEEKAQVNS